MLNFYPYLISSLPFLDFGKSPPFSFERFLEICKDFVLYEELEFLKNLKSLRLTNTKIKGIKTFKRWLDFEYNLRNELVKLRAIRKHIEVNKYIRPQETIEFGVEHIALGAVRNPSVIEAELILDKARWNKLEELERGHYFDIDFLIIYGIKLLILERWENFRKTDKFNILQEIFKKD